MTNCKTSTISLLLLIMILCLKNSNANGQQIDSTFQSETILKNDNKKTNIPFYKSELRWLKNNTFPINEYAWDNKEINLQLQKAINQRDFSNILIVPGIMLGLGGLLEIGLLSAMHDQQEKKDNSINNGKKLIVSSLVILPVVFVLKNGAKEKTKEANRMRLELKNK